MNPGPGVRPRCRCLFWFLVMVLVCYYVAYIPYLYRCLFYIRDPSFHRLLCRAGGVARPGVRRAEAGYWVFG